MRHPAVPARCVVTGGSGFVGQRLVEMLVERGAKRVVSFDIVPHPPNRWDHAAIEYVTGDLRDAEAVEAVCKGADCVWHNGAAVGPYHPEQLYYDVNYQGTLHVIDACKKHGVRKIVMSSSPSTRFDGTDVDGLRESDMPKLPQKQYLQDYAKTKAMGEMAMTQACCPELMTVAVAPHQVYGPRDNLFLPNLLETAGARAAASRARRRKRSRPCALRVTRARARALARSLSARAQARASCACSARARTAFASRTSTTTATGSSSRSAR